MMWFLITLCLYITPLYHLPSVVDNELYEQHFYPLLTIIFCTIMLLSYYSFFITKYKQYSLIHKKLFTILILSITSKILITLNISNVVYVYNNKPIYIFRWMEWLSTIYLMMTIINDTDVNEKYQKLYHINTLCQVLCILFGYISLFYYFWFFSILSKISHCFIFYVIYKTKNIFLILFEGVSLIIVIYYFMYFTGYIDISNYHLSIWICELLIKGIVVVLTTMNFMLKREHMMEEYIHKEKVFYIIHDLRIHLNSLRLGLSQCDTNEVTKMMKFSLNSMIKLINQILFFNKISKNNLELVKDFFSMQTLVRHVIDEFSFQFAETKIKYTLDIPEDYFIYADRNGIKTIFLNLMSNALKFAKKHIIFSVRFKKIDSEHIMVYFFVQDDGPGVPSFFVPYLFQPFSQVDSSKENSTGLGLYLSQQILKAHGGALEYEYNQGALFSGSIKTIFKRNYIESIPLSNEIFKVNHFPCKQVKKILLTVL